MAFCKLMPDFHLRSSSSSVSPCTSGAGGGVFLVEKVGGKFSLEECWVCQLKGWWKICGRLSMLLKKIGLGES